MRATYLVTPHQGGWSITFEGARHGVFSLQAVALTVAVQAANQAGKDGHDARVLVRGRDGQVRTEWTFGRDTYPPQWAGATDAGDRAHRPTANRHAAPR